MISDKIIISRIECAVHIGVEDWEREQRQPCAISLELSCNLRAASQSDDLRDAIDYAALIYKVSDFAESNTFHLMERLAEEVSALILRSYPITEVEVTIEKLQPPIERKIAGIAVRIRREASQ